MLTNNKFGYAVMNKELTAFTFESTCLRTCIKYCYNGDVVAMRIPEISGFNLSVVWHEWYKPFEFNRRMKRMNILKLHFNWHLEYLHRTGGIVYRSTVKPDGGRGTQ